MTAQAARPWKESLLLFPLLFTIGEENGDPLQYSCLENPMDGGAWWATVHGVAKSLTRLSDFISLYSCYSPLREVQSQELDRHVGRLKPWLSNQRTRKRSCWMSVQHPGECAGKHGNEGARERDHLNLWMKSGLSPELYMCNWCEASKESFWEINYCGDHHLVSG